jgi:hypothetical protein
VLEQVLLFGTWAPSGWQLPPWLPPHVPLTQAVQQVTPAEQG